MNNLLITGGTGLIGQELVNALLAKNSYLITVLTRSSAKAQSLFGTRINIVTELSQALIDKQNCIINLAGEPIADKRWSANQKQKICNSRWKITEKLTEFILRSPSPPQVFLSGSAIGVYGRQGVKVIDEDFIDYHQEFSREVCEKWESIALQASTVTRVCLLRTGVVLAENGGALGKMLLPFKLGLGGPIGQGEQIMSWIHIDDMVSAIMFVMDSDISGPINMTSPAPVSNKEFSQTLSRTLNRPCFMITPPWVLKLVFGEMSDLLLFGQHVLPKVLLANGFTFQYPELPGALHQLFDS